MNEKISTLMDGELDRDAAMQAIRHLGQDYGRRETWDHYHLIGDVLRGESSGEITRRQKSAEAIFAKLADEPTVLVPAAMKSVPVQKKTRMALAMAASIVTVSAIAVVALKQQSGVIAPVQSVQLTQPIQSTTSPMTIQVSNTVKVAKPTDADIRFNDYLAIHRQFANRNGLQSVSADATEPQRAAAAK